MQRACSETGDLFWVATSDIHQCRFSRPVREVKRKERAKAKRKVKREAEKARITELEAENESLRQQAG